MLSFCAQFKIVDNTNALTTNMASFYSEAFFFHVSFSVVGSLSRLYYPQKEPLTHKTTQSDRH